MDLVHLRVPIINELPILPGKLAKFNPKNVKIFYMIKSRLQAIAENRAVNTSPSNKKEPAL